MDGRPAGVGRWHHPEMGDISPSVFIPIAEESNQIQDIGDNILHKTCAQINTWKESGIITSDFKVSVNLSKAQLTSPEFPEHLLSIVKQYGIEPSDLKLEVTETTIVDNRAGVVDVLIEIRKMGFIVMMDDFGTGHSSLGGLHTLPIDELKIDQSFIRHEEVARDLIAITSSIITLAQHLSLKTVGEGIENVNNVALLQDMGCDYGQGYLFSKPLIAEAFEQWLLYQYESGSEYPATG